MRGHTVCVACAGLIVLLACGGARGESASCFLRNGDRWTILGDSITNNGGYIRMVRLALNHFHPGAEIAVNGVGVDGVKADHAFAGDGKALPATVVSIMLGTNNAIHSGYDRVDAEKALRGYAGSIEKQVKTYRANGSDVLLLSSPPVDEDYGRGWWELRGSNDLIREFPRILKKIAAENGAFYVPVQEGLEEYRLRLRRTFGIVRPLYPDGVHPNGWAQYEIARAILDRIGAAKPLAGPGDPRRLSEPCAPAPVGVAVDGKFLEPGARVALRLRSERQTDVVLSWSLGARRGKTGLSLGPEPVSWTVPLEPSELDAPPGRNRTLVFDIASGSSRSLHALDITGTRVRRPGPDGSAAGAVPAEGGTRRGTWRMAKQGNALLLSGMVEDPDVRDGGPEYTDGDGVQITLDLRQGPRFGDLSFDEDVHLFCLNVKPEPEFGLAISPVWGRGLSFAGSGAARRIRGGYAWHFLIDQAFKDRDAAFDVGKSDFIGFNIDITDVRAGRDGKKTGEWIKMAETEYMVQNFPAFLHILDMKNRLKGDRTMVLNLWGG